MFYISPLKITNVDGDFTFPLQIYHDQKINIEIIKISDADKEALFGVRKIVTPETNPEQVAKGHTENVVYQLIHNRPSISGVQLSVYYETEYCIKTEYDPGGNNKNDRYIMDLTTNINFITRLVWLISLPIEFITSDFPLTVPSDLIVSSTGGTPRGFSGDYTISANKIHKFISLINKLVVPKVAPPKNEQKRINAIETRIDLFKSLLDIAYGSRNSIGLSGSTFVTILESIFVVDSLHELSYKLGMRMTHYLGLDHAFFKQIKTWYEYRSKFYHSGIVKFQPPETHELAKVTSELLIEFILDPSKFDNEELDKKILQKLNPT